MALRRIKSYTAQTGFVYQYYFVGNRKALADAPEAPGTEYIFDATADRHSVYAVSVFLRQDALDAWALTHGRSLTDAEQYAAAKSRLLQGLDDIADIAADPRRLLIDSENIEEILAPLNLD